MVPVHVCVYVDRVNPKGETGGASAWIHMVMSTMYSVKGRIRLTDVRT